MLYKEITYCRSCLSTRLEPVLDLGNLYISDFIWPGDTEDKAPLELAICWDCSLVQLLHTVNRDRLYRNYYYRSGTNESMVAALRDISEDASKRVDLREPSYIVDIGSNDGTLLSLYPKRHVRYGFEPARNIKQVEPYNKSDLSGVKTYPIYFPPEWSPAKTAKIITSIACFYDVDDPNAFVAAIRQWLHPDGIWVCQMQDFHGTMATSGFDNICHEHLTYWTRPAFEQLLYRHDLHIANISYNKANGDSIRYTVKHGRGEPTTHSIGPVEYKHQLLTLDDKIRHLRRQVVELLDKLANDGQKVLGYGASTKGNILLQYFGITPDILPCIADRNLDKWGRITVGTHIPIFSEEAVREMHPDYLLVLPWHFLDSFLEREHEFLQRGGQFIVPLPNLHLIGGDRCPRYIPAETYVRA